MKSDLFIAAENGNIGSFRRSLNKGADINQADETGATPLMVASRLGHTELVKFILSKGADVNLADKQGMTARKNAEISNKPELLKAIGGSTQVDSSEEQIRAYSSFINFAPRLFPTLKQAALIIKGLAKEQKQEIFNDFWRIISLVGNKRELSEYDIFGLLLAVELSMQPENFDSVKYNSDSNEIHLDALKKRVAASEAGFNNGAKVTRQSFALKSLQSLSAENAESLKKTFYDFSEVMMSANEIAADQKSETLNFLSELFFKQKQVAEKSVESQESAKPDLAASLEELNNLVGMDNIKNDIHSLINNIKMNKLRKNEGLPEISLSLHSVFMGPPGTGKTTIARILSKIYHALDLLPQNNFKETDRTGLVAGYIGQTAIKTDKIINEALNGILFIDEAYSLAGESMDDYGKEAISTLLKRMEDYRDKLIVIVAGYEKEMSNFINSNPGLKSRFNRYFHFKDYTPTELTEIYRRLADEKKLILKEESLDRARELFELLYSLKDRTFGNARVARNAFEKTYEKWANRTSSLSTITREILTTIEPVDVPTSDELRNTEND